MLPLLFIAGLLAAGTGYAKFGEWRDSRRRPAPGRLIDVGSHKLHLNRQGSGDPVVVLESGIASSSLAWMLVQPELARFTTVCSYDRAGLGWSDSCPRKRSLTEMSSELRALLDRAALKPPFVLVAHSFGGLIVRAYAHLYPDDVAGLVLVDPVAIHSWAECTATNQRRLAQGIKLSRRGALLARLGVVRIALDLFASGGRFLPKLIARTSARKGKKTLDNLIGEVRKLPPETWPLIRANWSLPKCFESMACHLESLPESARLARDMKVPAQIPLTVLSASNATKEEIEEREVWVSGSNNGKHFQVPGTGHWLHLERPDLVVDTVREMVKTSQTRKAVARLS